MPPIRWDNINAPDFRASIAAVSAASTNFDAVGANLQRLAAEQTKINNANWENQATLNDNAKIADISKISALSDMHQNIADVNAGALSDEYGRQIHPDIVAAFQNKQLGILNSGANNRGIEAANTSLAADNDPVAAIKAMTAEQANAGMLASTNHEFTNDYATKNRAYLDDIIKNQNAKLLNAQLANTVDGKQIPGVSTIDQITAVRNDPSIAIGVKPDVIKAIGSGSELATKDQEAGLKATVPYMIGEWNKAVEETGSTEEADKLLSQHPDKKLVMATSSSPQLIERRKELQAISTLEEDKLKIRSDSLDNHFNKLLAPAAKDIQIATESNEKNRPVSEDFFKAQSAEAMKSGKSIVDYIVSTKTDDSGPLGIKTWGSGIKNSDELRAELTSVTDNLVKKGFTQDEIDRVVLGAVTKRNGTKESWIGSHGYSVSELLAGLGDSVQKAVAFKENAQDIQQKDINLKTNQAALGTEKLRMALLGKQELIKAKARYKSEGHNASINLDTYIPSKDSNYVPFNKDRIAVRTPIDVDSILKQINKVKQINDTSLNDSAWINAGAY